MSTGRRRLLVADDSPTVQKVISLTFEDEGFEVVAAGGGAEALSILEAGTPPDLLLADVIMPGPDGYALCERVKRDPRLRHVPVILLVGKFEPFNEAEARRVGADTVLTKPFQSIRDLVSKVGSLIGGESKESEHGDEAAGRGEASAGHATPRPEPARAAEPERRSAEPEAAPLRRPFGESDAQPNAQPNARADARPADESTAAHEATPAAAEPGPSPAPSAGAAGDHSDMFRTDPSSSFADLGVDDEMIEARPAESFGARSHSAPQPSSVSAQPPAAATQPVTASAEPAAARAESAAPDASLGSHAFESREPQHAFAARAAAAATADDALLDLGGFGPSEPASARAAEADDFILDLADDEPSPAPAPAAASTAPEPAAEAAPDFWSHPGSEPSFAPFDGPAGVDEIEGVDEAAAFAEAAHGEPAERADLFGADSEPPAEVGAHDPVVVREVVAEDVPPSFESFELRDDPLDFGGGADFDERGRDFGAGRQGGDEFGFFDAPAARPEDSAPRGFIEPTVVPAEEPERGGAWGEFVDGSVEGDLPKPPVAAAPETETAGFELVEAEALTADETFEPSPSSAPQPVGQARAGFDERPGAGGLSAEDVDAIARRVVELMSDRVVREIAWEVVPELAELHVRRKLEEERRG